MNKFILMMFSGLLGVAIMGCEGVDQRAEAVTEMIDESNPLIGAWEFVSGSISLPDTVLSLENSTDRVGLFFFSESHWGFVASTPSNQELVFAGRGTYAVDGNTYIEHVEFHTAPEVIGTSIEFDFEVKGDTLKKVGFIPVWEEIRELAGDEIEVRVEEIRVRASSQSM